MCLKQNVSITKSKRDNYESGSFGKPVAGVDKR